MEFMFLLEAGQPDSATTHLVECVLSPGLSTLAGLLDGVVLVASTATLGHDGPIFVSKMNILLPPQLVASGWPHGDSAALELVWVVVVVR